MRVIGLDIGTNSIGWGIIDESDSIKPIKKCGVYIFPEGVKNEKGNESSKAAERTRFRSARRLKFRRKLRKYETLKVLIANDMCPLSMEELELWRKKKIYPTSAEFIQWYRTDERRQWEPYFLRKKCVEQKAEKYEIGRSLYHLAQRRGFLSNRKETTKENENGKVKGAIDQLTQDKGDKTLGQYFYELKIAGEKVRGKYTSRKLHYEEEFNTICDVQHIPTELKASLYKALFFQRKLKSQKFLIGNCTFEKNKPRCAISHFEFEEFRMLSFINSIKIAKNADESDRQVFQFLSAAEKDAIKPLFFRTSKKSFKFDDIAKKLKGKNEYWIFNYRNDTNVSGCPVLTALQNIFGENWKETKIGQYDIFDIWHVLFDFDDDEKLKEFAETKLHLDEDHTKIFCKISFQQGYANISLKAIRKILPFLREGYLYTYAAFLANIPFMIGEDVFEKNKTHILTGIQNIIDTIKDTNTCIAITNTCIEKIFKDTEHDFRIEEWDKEILNHQIKDFYGAKKWKEFPAEKQHALTKEITEKIEESLKIAVTRKSNDYKYPPMRTDDLIYTFLQESGFNIKKGRQLYHPSDVGYNFEKPVQTADGKIYLASPKCESVKNPVAMRALFQLRKLINYLIKTDEIDTNTRIHVELANEMNDKNWRKAIEEFQKDNEKKNEEYRKKISETAKENGCDFNPTDEDIKKYRLWKEQDEECPYTGKHIKFSDLFGEHPQFDFEHTIPRSLSYDDSLENLTLCDVQFNRTVKKQKIPSELAHYDEIAYRFEKYYEKEIDRCLSLIENNKIKGGYIDSDQKDKKIVARHISQLELDYYKGKLKRFNAKDITSGFKNSQLNDTRIITKFALAYLKGVFSYVQPVKGSLTDVFKRQWGLLRVGEKKERSTYEHHAIDALTVACVNRGKYNILCEVIRKSPDGKHIRLPKPWETFDSDVLHAVSHIIPKFYVDDNSLRQTKKILRNPRTGKPALKNGQMQYIQGHTARGSLHKDTFYGCIMTPPVKGKASEKIFVQKISCANLTEKEAEKIIDDGIRKSFFKNLEAKVQTLQEIQTQGILLPFKINGKAVYTKKMRVKAKTTAPLPIKNHYNLTNKPIKEYKQHYYVVNDENYLLAIYRGKNEKQKEESDFRVVNLLDAVHAKQQGNPLYPKTVLKQKNELDLYKVIKIGKTVILQETADEDVFALPPQKLWNRIYRISGLASSSGSIQIKLVHTSVSQPWKYLKGKLNLDDMTAFRLYSPSNIHCFLEGTDFKVLPTGEIETLK